MNSATGIYNYPSSPSRIQLSIWPGGLPSAPQGTIDWAGGLIDWFVSSFLRQTKVEGIVERHREADLMYFVKTISGRSLSISQQGIITLSSNQ